MAADIKFVMKVGVVVPLD